MIQTIISLPRQGKKLFLVGFDFLLLCGSLWLAFFIRLEQWWPSELDNSALHLLWAPLLALPVFISMGLYNAVIRYIAPRFVFTIVQAVTMATVILIVVVVFGAIPEFPRSAFALYWINSLVLIGGSRLVAREFLALPLEGDKGKTLVAIYGAGAAGTQICKALQSSAEFQPVAFLDDNRKMHDLQVLGCTVFPPEELGNLIVRYRLEEVILSMPSESLVRRKQIIEFLQQYPVLVKTLPGIPEMVSNKIQVDHLRKVEIEDLLGRDPVQPNESLLKACISGKNVLVTGAGGSIGSELCTQIAGLGPARLVLLELNEYVLYQKDMDLRQRFPELEVVAVLGSVGDRLRLNKVLETHSIETIYHAAAYKHVPMVEANLVEGVKNNVFGTRILAEAAVAHGVETFILISTDKAVRPTNVMGATKRFAEMILQDLAREDGPTRFTMVRFGNVLGSSGSVVPLFRRQIREGGPVTVTDPEITRYFMTIPEAAQLVIQAGSMGQGGDVFVLDMGDSVKIVDLARKMIQLSGLSVKDAVTGVGDIAIQFTGLRPGEKLYEELLIGDNVFATEHSRIKRAEESCPASPKMAAILDQLAQAVEGYDSFAIRNVFANAGIGFEPQSSIVDVATRPRPRVLPGVPSAPKRARRSPKKDNPLIPASP